MMGSNRRVDAMSSALLLRHPKKVKSEGTEALEQLRHSE